MADLAGAAEIARRGGEPRGDDVPGGAAVADVVDRGELPREVERLGVGRRGRRDQPDPAGRHRHRRQHGDRLEPGARRLRHIARPAPAGRRGRSNSNFAASARRARSW